MQEAKEERAEAREIRRQAREQQQRFLMPGLAYPPPYHSPYAPHQMAAPLALPLSLPPSLPLTTPQKTTIPVLSSSPLSGAGKADSRAHVKAFFKWLVAEQPEEDQEDYIQAQQVAVEQRWTVKDLKEMATPQSELYLLATSAPYRLKDRIIRHFHKDLRQFKTALVGVNLRRLTAVDGYLAVIYGLPRRCSTAGVNLRRLTAVDGCLAVIYTACHAGMAPQALVGVNLRRLTAIDGYLAVIYGLPRSYGTASVT
ncbi:hypothetical protein BCR34DRAFT_591927 [Clohesyomyces aquaticus]|uniref:Uncharacterized protein n=1 Tax=Clohesyomyces aquaticus TaxID=1231657 RepID=A0A1Y1YWW3_9PLEO|nr:hypothetical protein BCR34DRAFT_591927 [Clohesyomyces aquaticus]